MVFEKLHGQIAKIGIAAIQPFTPHHPTNQSLSARALASLLSGKDLAIERDENGKPIAKNESLNLSLSHSKNFAAAIVSSQKNVGIDIETIHPRIERIAHKFLKPSELQNITTNKVETLILYWSAKESLYKLYSKKQLDFASQLIIQPFELKQKGTLTGSIIVHDAAEIFSDLSIHYEFLKGELLTYVIGR